MSRPAVAFAAAGLAAAQVALRPADTTRVVIVGDSVGYLSPCGCTSPMSGGIRRRATAIRSGGAAGSTVILDVGGSVGGAGRQHVLKSETYAESLRFLGVSAWNLTLDEAKLGRGQLMSLARLSGGRLTSASVRDDIGGMVIPDATAGSLAVTGIAQRPERLAALLGVTPVATDTAIPTFVQQASDDAKLPTVLLDGDREAARQLARAYPDLRLVVYRAATSPPRELERVGKTALVTPGEHGKAVVSVLVRDGAISDYTVTDLGPAFGDDPDAARVYRTYLKRVEAERLLEKIPRASGPAFAGTEKCGTCHVSSLKVWRKSEHAHALKTLETDGHGKDPECLPCHVVGLSTVPGFHSREATPTLANVGCESCHGAGAGHAQSPYKVRLPKIGERACLPCHNPSNSPKFDFKSYWSRVFHR